MSYYYNLNHRNRWALITSGAGATMMLKIKTMNRLSLGIVFVFLFQCSKQNNSNLQMKQMLKFETNYNQFYLTSDDAQHLTPGSQTDQGYNDRLDVVKNTLVVFTQCYGPVKGELIVVNQPSATNDLDSYDHVVEAGMAINSGTLKVLNCPYSLIEFETNLRPGNYRVRIYSSNLESVDIDDEKGGDDYYKIEMWPSNDMERRVLKRYERVNTDENEITPKPDSLK